MGAISIIVAGAIIGLGFLILSDPIFGGSMIQLGMPSLRDDALELELVVEGLMLPTSMRFLDESNILVLQQRGEVRLVSNGKLLEQPVLQVDVESLAEQGLLGIAIWKDQHTDVFLYFTEKTENDILRNRVYKYNYDSVEKILVNRTLVLELPGEPGPYHNGGKIDIGPDGYLYAVIGDTNAGGGMLDNALSGREPDDKSVVLRVDRESGQGVNDNPFYSDENEMLHRYFAYGIRNSFGMAFDPVTNYLWITDNGEDEYDEVNLVLPGFNSGWHKLMGPMSRTDVTEADLVMFDGAHYADPVFSWRDSIGVTDIEFLDSGKLGEEYRNNIFVGDINNGNLYFFEVNEERDGLVLEGDLSDLVADNIFELSAVIHGTGFGGITDIETGPDGNLYILTYVDGKIYRVTTN